MRTACSLSDPTQCESELALAITRIMVKRDGHIVDADIEVNAFHWAFTDLLQAAHLPGAADFQNVITHELRHFVGLDHTCFAPSKPDDLPPIDAVTNEPVPYCASAPSDVLATTMSATTQTAETNKRDLEPDDVDAVCASYPSRLDPHVCTPAGEGGCGCAAGASGHAAPWLFGLVGVAVLFGRRVMRHGRHHRRPAQPGRQHPGDQHSGRAEKIR